MSVLTIIGILAAVYLAWSYAGPAIQAASSVSRQSIAVDHEPMDRETAACMCCDLADYFESLGDEDSVRMCGRLADRVVAGDRTEEPTGGAIDVATA